MSLALQTWGEGPFIRAVSVRTGEIFEDAKAAVSADRYDVDQHLKDGYVGVRRTESPMRDFMLRPAQDALHAAGIVGETLRQITHTSIHDHGAEGLWQPAAFLQDQLQASSALGWSLQHGCNGFGLAMIQSCAMMSQLQGPALIVGADIFDNSGFDRWQSDKGLVYGDASGAMVLDPDKGFARIVYQDTVSIAALEGMHGSQQAVTADTRWDITKTKQSYFAKHGSQFFFAAIAEALDAMRGRLMREMDAVQTQIDAVVTPFVGQSVRASTYEAYFHPLAPDNTSRTLGMETGHTGTTDQIIGLAHHLAHANLKAGSHVLLIGAGAGFSTSATVIRIERTAQNPQHGVFS